MEVEEGALSNAQSLFRHVKVNRAALFQGDSGVGGGPCENV